MSFMFTPVLYNIYFVEFLYSAETARIPKVKEKSNRQGERDTVTPGATVNLNILTPDVLRTWSITALRTFLSLRDQRVEGDFEELVSRYTYIGLFVLHMIIYNYIYGCTTCTYNFMLKESCIELVYIVSLNLL